jgi:hypothetical protein
MRALLLLLAVSSLSCVPVASQFASFRFVDGPSGYSLEARGAIDIAPPVNLVVFAVPQAPSAGLELSWCGEKVGTPWAVGLSAGVRAMDTDSGWYGCARGSLSVIYDCGSSTWLAAGANIESTPDDVGAWPWVAVGQGF